MQEFPILFYESNEIWRSIDCLEELLFVFRIMTKSKGNSINTVDDFLDKSKRCEDSTLFEFGTRREHNSDESLRDFLKKHNLLDEFLILAR